MLKFLECPDLHFDPEGLEMFNIWSNEILKQAVNVDYVAFPGDIWKSVTTNDNKGGISLMLIFIEKLSKICPVVAIEGTPSHDAPGSYEILERAGLVLLKPGVVYGYCKDDGIFKVENTLWDGQLDSILFGVPELNKNNIHAQLNLSAEQANGKAVESFENYMDEFVAPMRLKYKDIPAHMLFHGNVSDSLQENSTDIIMKSSEIVIHSDVFARANLTRVSLGHIHKPWESEKCSMGYAGSPGLKWGERGFIPAMNLGLLLSEKEASISIPTNKDFHCGIKRLPYGSPERKKIYKTSSIVPGKNIAYWLVSDTEVLPEGVHPWSRVTKPSNSKRSTRRATEEQIEAVQNLWDLALLLDSTLDKRLRPKFDLLQEKNKKEATEKINVVIDNVEILGCKFFSGDRAYLNVSGLNNGLTAIGGEINGMCNGIGKSSILSFCSPFPTVVGKDTKSGRTSALKDFFFMKDSRIIKHLTVNGVKHEHIITIKAAHTKTGGKVECYLNIEGVPQLDKGTFDEMQTMCESLYGSYQDYLLTSFYVQPLQGKSGSSLMSANMTTIRDLVQGIAGIDRSQEKRMAQDEILKLEKELDGIDIKIETLTENLKDKDPVLLEIQEIQEEIKTLISEINTGNKRGKSLKGELDTLLKIQVNNNNNKTLVTEKYSQILDMDSKINNIPDSISKLEKSLSTINTDKETLKKYESDRIVVDKYNSDFKDYRHYFSNIVALKNRRTGLKVKLEDLIIPDKLDLEKKITDYGLRIQSLKIWKENCQSIKDINAETMVKYNKDISEFSTAESNFEHDKFILESDIEKIGNEIRLKKELMSELDNPCDHCGKISKQAEFKTEKILSELKTLQSDKSEKIKSLDDLKFILVEPKDPELNPLPGAPFTDDNLDYNLSLCNQSLSNIEILLNQKKDIEFDIRSIDKEISGVSPVTEPDNPGISLTPDFIISDVKRRVENSTDLQVEINTLKNELKSSSKRKIELENEISGIIIDYEIDDKISEQETEINSLRTLLTDKQATGSRLQESLKNLNKRIDAIDVEINKIQEMKDGISEQLQDKEDWVEIAMLLGSNKIPALELDIKLDAIDNEATKILEPYQDGQFSFRSTTQVEGKKQAADKFDIKIHDSITGIEKSFLEFSPGVKAVFSDAMVKALINNRNTNTYNPTIVDEADNPVNPKHIQEFYMIQENYFRQDPEMKVLIVSQCTEAKAYIENFKDIKEIRQ